MINLHNLEPQRYWAPKASDSSIQVAKNRIFSGDWIGARKIDGSFWKFVKNNKGNMELLSRSRNVNGIFLNKIEWVPQLKEFFNQLPNGTCLLGELFFPDKEGSRHVTTIMGCGQEKAVERQENNKFLTFYIFDCLAYNGTDFLNITAEQRFNKLEELSKTYTSPYVMWARYFSGQELWTELQTILANGGEGVVISLKDGTYEPGKRPKAKTMKVKKELRNTIDCFFTGKVAAPTKRYEGKEIETWEYWINSITLEPLPKHYYIDEYMDGEAVEPVTKAYYYGWAGSLEIGVYDKSGKIKPIGWLSGLDEDIKSNYKKYIMKPIEVSAMEMEADTKALRHGKFLGFRDDLSLADCTWEKIIGA